MKFHQMDKLCVAHGATSIADAIEATSECIVRRKRSGYRYDRRSGIKAGFTADWDSEDYGAVEAYHFDIGSR